MPRWSSAAPRPSSWSIRARATGCRSAPIASIPGAGRSPGSTAISVAIDAGAGPRPLHPAPPRRCAAAAADHLLRRVRADPPGARRPRPRAARLAPLRSGNPGGDPRAISPQRPFLRAVRHLAVACAAGRFRPLDPGRPAGDVGDPPAARRHDLSRHRQRDRRARPRHPARHDRRLPPRLAARPRRGHGRRARHQLAFVRHRHLPALSLRRRARLVPHLRRRPRLPRPLPSRSPAPR